MKDVFTFSGEDGTIVAWNLTVWTTSVKGHSTDSADIIIWDVPFPYRYGVDAFDLDFHHERTNERTNHGEHGSRTGRIPI
jgi:hypothetical protein